MELIREEDYFTCNINGEDYKCCIDVIIGWHLNPRIKVTVKKYIEKTFWKFKYKSLEFEYDKTYDIKFREIVRAKGALHFHPEYIKQFIERAIYNRKWDIEKATKKEEFENSINLINRI